MSIETMNRSESPSPGLRPPSPPLNAGERAGRGGVAWKVARRESPGVARFHRGAAPGPQPATRDLQPA